MKYMEKCICGKECANHLGLKAHQRFCKQFKEAGVSEVSGVETVATPKVESRPDYTRYKQLPPPVVKHLENTWGNWLNHFEVWNEWTEGFGGYGLFVKVPKEFSTEVNSVTYPVYNNETRKRTGEKTVETVDIRAVSLKDATVANKYLDRIKQNIIEKAHQRGIQLPSTNIRYESPNNNLEDYKRQLAGV